ncbi:IS256 family transposase [Geochorda subterranea]
MQRQCLLQPLPQALRRPRVRRLQGREELVPPTYRALQDEATLGEAALEQSLAGVAMRRYGETMPDLLGIPDELPVTHVSRSTVSRRFLAEAGAILAEVLHRPLSERYLVVFLDGLALGEHQVVAAVGVTEAGQKRVLALWEGVTESREVCQALVEDLAARGLSAQHGLLVVIDGSKALAAAVRAVWGERALIQRCVCHKARNVLEKLPRSLQGMVRRRLARAWGEADAAAAALSLQALADRLDETGYAEAAAR